MGDGHRKGARISLGMRWRVHPSLAENPNASSIDRFGWNIYSVCVGESMLHC